jgi:2-polyprenyl-3-methyl-5-hydroxy-6-metoxy-1,4-benzoquinol methylase
LERAPHWETSWDTIGELTPIGATSFFGQVLQSFPDVPRGQKSALEIGCFPGQFIDYLGGKGYQVSGFDTYERTPLINDWLRKRGHDVGGFQCKSLDQYLVDNPGIAFDVVISLGFIEHFENFCDVLHKHARLCRVGGGILVGAPNFASPMQRALHETLDKTNLSKHVLQAMYPKVWALYLASIGFQIRHAGSVGRFSFWTETPTTDEKIRLLQSMLPRAAPVVTSLGDVFNQQEAGYGVVLAVKVRETPADDDDNKAFAGQCLALAQELSAKDKELSEPMSALLAKMMR